MQNRWPDVAFPGPEFQLPAFSLFVQTLHIMREKALELLQKALLCLKTSQITVGKHDAKWTYQLPQA